jgi:hypothetical protein
MRTLLFLPAVLLYIAALLQLRHAWRHLSAEGAALGRARRWWLGLAAGAHYFEPQGRTALRRARWLFTACAVVGVVWLAVAVRAAGAAP